MSSVREDLQLIMSSWGICLRIHSVFEGNSRSGTLRSHHVPHLGMYSIVIDLPAFWALFCSCWPLKEEKAITSDVARARVARIAVVFIVDGLDRKIR